MTHTKIPFETELALFHQASKIPLCVFDNTPTDLLRYPFINSMDCSPLTLQKCCEALKNNQEAPYFPLLFSSSSCFFALLKLNENTNIIFGPISSIPLTYKELYAACQTGYIPEDLLHLYRIIQQSPHISLSQFVNNLSLFIQLVFRKKISPEEILANHVSFPRAHLPQKETPDSEPHYLTISEAITFQKKILALIQTGNIHEIEDIFEKTPFFTNLEMSPSSAEDLKKIFFIYATLCCVVVLEEGLNLQKAFPIFDTYIAKIPSITTPENLAVFCREITIDYCQHMVSLKSTRSDSPVVTKCLQYIQDNLYTKISINDLAQHCQLSKRTITRHFSEYYHVSVAEYILFHKLKEASFLLIHSDLSLAEISNYLAFSSQSHFSVAFKKQYHYTPQKYREKYKTN